MSKGRVRKMTVKMSMTRMIGDIARQCALRLCRSQLASHAIPGSKCMSMATWPFILGQGPSASQNCRY